MNSLMRQIVQGEVVVMQAKYMIDPQADRRFRCEGGFGMQSFTTGTSIFGTWLADGERDKVNAMLIDPEATATLPKD